MAVLALVLVPGARAGGPTMVVGAAEDVVRSTDLVTAKASMTMLQLAGFRAVRITSIWAPGETAPTGVETKVLRNVAAAASLSGVRVYVSVYHAGSRTTPLTDKDRADFSAYAASLAQAFPSFRDFIVGNEPNLNRFWLPQFAADGTDAAAPAYLALLASSYDALKGVSPFVKVYGGALAPRGIDRPGTGRDTHSPTSFIRDLGAAYRASGRAGPVMDAFAFHPYADNSSQSPDFAHPLSTTIGVADYGKLVSLLAEAFDGTAQPGSMLPLLYDEFGVESIVPAAKAPLYTGAEPVTTKPVEEATQAAYYAKALSLTFCQPNVVGVLFFHSQDEPALASWQSGVYYADGSPKTSLPAVRAALNASRGGSIARCPGLSLPVTPKVTWRPRTLGLMLRCNLDCTYRVRLVKLPRRTTTAAKSGRLSAGTELPLTLARKVAPGTYALALSVVHPVNPGAPAAAESAAFKISATSR